MTADPVTDLEWADRLERIAAAVSKTVYDHDLTMSERDRERKVTWDDADLLRNLANELRVRDYRRLLAEAEAKLAR